MMIETKDKKMQVAPGESSELRGTFLLGNYAGTVEKTIRVWLEGDSGDALHHGLRQGHRHRTAAPQHQETGAGFRRSHCRPGQRAGRSLGGIG